MNFRVVGGLLSAYDLSGDKMFLEKAKDIADRLLPAWDTPSGIPYNRINLALGNPSNHGWTGVIYQLPSSIYLFYLCECTCISSFFFDSSTLGLPFVLWNFYLWEPCRPTSLDYFEFFVPFRLQYNFYEMELFRFLYYYYYYYFDSTLGLPFVLCKFYLWEPCTSNILVTLIYFVGFRLQYNIYEMKLFFFEWLHNSNPQPCGCKADHIPTVLWSCYRNCLFY